MNQTKLESLLEVAVSIAIGFCVSLAFWRYVVVPLFKLPVGTGENLEITALFTVLSVVRSYIMRRFFNAGLHKAIHQFVKGVLYG